MKDYSYYGKGFYIEKKLHGAKRFNNVEILPWPTIEEAKKHIADSSNLYDYRIVDIETNLKSPIIYMGKEQKQ